MTEKEQIDMHFDFDYITEFLFNYLVGVYSQRLMIIRQINYQL